MNKYMLVTLTLLFSCMATDAHTALDRDAAMRDAAVDAQVFASVVDASTSDGKAIVYQLDGKAVITSKGNPEERDLKVGDEIGMGDAIYTEKGANLSISFDNRKQNAVRIPAETKATFTSIEPTDIKLDDGTIFSIVNGLAKGSTWKVTTPTAVAAVRGTVFETTYHADTKEFFAATLEVSDDGKISAIEVESLTGEGMAEVVEGKEISFKEGEAPSQEMVQDFSAEKMAEVQQFNREVSTERENSKDDTTKGPGGPNGPGGPGTGGGNTTGGTAGQTGGANYAANAAAEALARSVAGGLNNPNNNTQANAAAQELARQVAGGHNPANAAYHNTQANMTAEALAHSVATANMAGSPGGGWHDGGAAALAASVAAANGGGDRFWNDGGAGGNPFGGEITPGGIGGVATGGESLPGNLGGSNTTLDPFNNLTFGGCDAACQNDQARQLAYQVCVSGGGTNCPH